MFVQSIAPGTRSTERRHGADYGAQELQAEPDMRELYARYRGVIYAHCARFLREPTSAEDATQEVFLRAWRHAKRLPDAAELRPWLFRVATNYCLNELRTRDARTRSLRSLAYVLPPHNDETLFGQNDARRFLERLPPRARAVAWLTFVDGMLQKEVAATLGVSRRTVVSHLSQVRAKMKEVSVSGA